MASVVSGIVSSWENISHEEKQLGLNVGWSWEETCLSLRDSNVLSLCTSCCCRAKELASTIAPSSVALLAIEALA